MHHPIFTRCNAVVATIGLYPIQEALIMQQGDYHLSYVELVERLGGQGEEQEYMVRMTPLHLHIGATMQLIEISSERLLPTVVLRYETYESFLAPRNLVDPSGSILAPVSDMVYIEHIRDRSDTISVIRVAPVVLHIAGNTSHVKVMDYWFSNALPMQAFPEAQHDCRQMQLLGVLQAENWDSRL